MMPAAWRGPRNTQKDTKKMRRILLRKIRDTDCTDGHGLSLSGQLVLNIPEMRDRRTAGFTYFW